MHGRQDLDVPDRIEAETPGNPLRAERQDQAEDLQVEEVEEDKQEAL